MQKEKFKVKINPTPKQKLCWKRLLDKETGFILFGGGAGGGKSWIGCEWLVVLCLSYPGVKLFIGRNELKRIMQSTYITFQKVCRWHDIPRDSWKFNAQQSYVEFWNGSRIDFLDLKYKPQDPLYERFGSIEYTCGFIEEAGEVKYTAFDVLKSRIGRHLNDEYNLSPKMLCTCNPKKNWLYFEIYKPWKESILSEDWIFIQSLYTDNPYTVSTYGKMLDKIKDPVLRQRLKDGNWEYDSDDSALMTYEHILNMFTNAYVLDPTEEMYLSVDVARFGRDKAVFTLWQGHFIKKLWFYAKSDMTFIEESIKKTCDRFRIPRGNVIVDEDGMGGGVVDHVNGVIGFVNGSRAIEEMSEDDQETDRYSYRNLRSQCYFKLAELINENKLGVYEDISPEIRNWIIEELEAIRRKDATDNEKKLQVISKDEIKDTIGRSPDFADSLMMRCYFDLGILNNPEIEIEW